MKLYNFAQTSEVRDYHYDTEIEQFVLTIGDGDIIIRVDAHLSAQQIDVIMNSVLGA